jgi:hypothetical protein
MNKKVLRISNTRIGNFKHNILQQLDMHSKILCIQMVFQKLYLEVLLSHTLLGTFLAAGLQPAAALVTAFTVTMPLAL